MQIHFITCYASVFSKNRLREERGQNYKIMSEKIYYLKDMTLENRLEWITGLNKSGYAGCNKQGTIVDRREFPKALPVQANSLFSVVKPKEL